MTISEIVSRPKKRYRDTASEDEHPEHEGDGRGAQGREHRELCSASRTPSLWYATENHFVEKFSIGQLWVTLSLNT